MEPASLRGGLCGTDVAEGVRRRRSPVQPPGDLPRGDGARRGTAPRRRDRARNGRPDDHRARHRRPEDRAPREDPLHRGDLVPGLLRAGRRLRPLRRPHERAADLRGRPLRRQRAEGVVVVRPHRRLVHPRHAQRPRQRAACGPHVPARRHARGGGRGPAAAADHRRGRVQRDLLQRRRGARRERRRRDRRRLAGGDDDAPARARHARLRAHRRARVADPQADGAREGDRRDRGAARRDRARVDRPAGGPLHELPLADDADEDRHPRPGGLWGEALVVGGEPARDEARARAPRLGGAAPERRQRQSRLLAAPAAPLARQHDRGRHVGDPAQHHRRARARPARRERSR